MFAACVASVQTYRRTKECKVCFPFHPFQKKPRDGEMHAMLRLPHQRQPTTRHVGKDAGRRTLAVDAGLHCTARRARDVKRVATVLRGRG